MISAKLKVERLRILRQMILDHTEQFNYSRWCVPDNTYTGTNGVSGQYAYLAAIDISNRCGTQACVAGFAVGCAPHDWLEVYLRTLPGPYSIPDIAQDWLELTAFERGFLFMGDSYLDEFDDISLEDDNANVDEALRRINKVIQCTEAGIDMSLVEGEYQHRDDDMAEDDDSDRWEDDDDWDDDDDDDDSEVEDDDNE